MKAVRSKGVSYIELLIVVGLIAIIGASVSPSFSEDFNISSSVTISGLAETTFSKLRVEPSNTLNITISTDIGSSTVTLNAVGGMEIN